MTISEGETAKQRKLANKLCGIMRGGSTILDLMKNNLNVSIALKNEDTEKLVATLLSTF